MVVEYELADAVARIYLNRPHRLNAVVPELAVGLAMALAKQALDGGAECALEEAMAAEVDFAALTVAPEAVRDDR